MKIMLSAAGLLTAGIIAGCGGGGSGGHSKAYQDGYNAGLRGLTSRRPDRHRRLLVRRPLSGLPG